MLDLACFKPEFINRLTGTVVFNDMDEQMATLILRKKLDELQKKLNAKQVTMTLTATRRQEKMQAMKEKFNKWKERLNGESQSRNIAGQTNRQGPQKND